MAVWSEVRSGEYNIADRFDADFFRPEYLSYEKKLKNCRIESIAHHFLISDGNHLKISNFFLDNNEGVPYFRGQDLNGFFLENSCPTRIPKSIYMSANMHRSHFESGDVLVCIVGASTGTISIVTDQVLPATGSCKIGILRKSEGGKVDHSVLAAFLFGMYGQYQIARNTRGTAQTGIILKDIFRIRIPLFNESHQNEIKSFLEKSIQANREGKRKYSEAQHLLQSELGLDKLKFKKPVGYTARFSTVGLSDAFNAGRIDAQCFAPNAVFYEKWLRNHNQCDILNHLLIAKIKGRQQEETEKGSTDYCSIKHISGHEMTDASKCLSSSDIPLANQNNLLLAITGATIGKIGIVKRYKQLAFSGDLLCLKISPEIDPHYLLVVLDHTIGQVQFNRWITGSTNGHLAPRDVGRVLVPRLRKRTESRIVGLVGESLSKRVESEQLLDQAKSRVEQLIEEAAAQ